MIFLIFLLSLIIFINLLSTPFLGGSTTKVAELIFFKIFGTKTDDFNPLEIRELYRFYNKEKDTIKNKDTKNFVKQVSEEILKTKVLPF